MKASDLKQFDVVHTGFANLDKVTGVDGIPLTKITEISGQFSVGKTTLALSIVAKAQKKGLKTLWVDTEWGFDPQYSESLGVQNDKLEIIQEQFAETVLDETEEWISENKDGFVVLDSIGGLLPRAEAEKGADGKVIGGQAKLIATFCRKVVPLLVMNNVGLLVLNHEFTDLMTGRLMTSGGAKLGYHKSLWVRLRKTNKRIMQADRQIGDVILAEIRKNKLASTLKQSIELQLMYGDGFNPLADLLQSAIDKEVIEKRGNSYYMDGERLSVGMPKLREKMKEPGFSEKLEARL